MSKLNLQEQASILREYKEEKPKNKPISYSSEEKLLANKYKKLEERNRKTTNEIFFINNSVSNL